MALNRADQTWPDTDTLTINEDNARMTAGKERTMVTELRRYLFNGIPLCLHIENGAQCGRIAAADERLYGGFQRCPDHRIAENNSDWQPESCCNAKEEAC